jgi:hypothetical protein
LKGSFGVAGERDHQAHRGVFLILVGGDRRGNTLGDFPAPRQHGEFVRVELNRHGQDRRRVVRHRSQHDRIVLDHHHIVGIGLERRELHVFPLGRRCAAGLRGRDARNLGRLLRHRGQADKRKEKAGQQFFHGSTLRHAARLGLAQRACGESYLL